MFNGALLPESLWRISKKVTITTDRKSIIWNQPFAAMRRGELFETAIFAEFVDLSGPEAKAGDFVTFGRAFGPLLLCEHGLPVTHIDVRHRQYFPDDIVEGHMVDLAYGRLRVVEPVARWRSLSMQGRTMVEIGDRLKRGKPTTEEHWDAIRELLPTIQAAVLGGSEHDPVVTMPMLFSEQPLATQRNVLAAAVQTWLDWGSVRTNFSWKEGVDRPSTRLGASTLFGVLALGLALTVTQTKYTYICVGCGEEFTGRRPRVKGQRPWCGKPFCTAEKNRLEQQRFRDRKQNKVASP